MYNMFISYCDLPGAHGTAGRASCHVGARRGRSPCGAHEERRGRRESHGAEEQRHEARRKAQVQHLSGHGAAQGAGEDQRGADGGQEDLGAATALEVGDDAAVEEGGEEGGAKEEEDLPEM